MSAQEYPFSRSPMTAWPMASSRLPTVRAASLRRAAMEHCSIRGNGLPGRRAGSLAWPLPSELTPEPFHLRQELGFGEPPCAKRRGRSGHRTYVWQLNLIDLQAPAADRTHQVVIRAIGHHGH
jgi:hypothetical protein